MFDKNFLLLGKDEMDHDELDDTMGSDMEDHMSDTDSKKDGNAGEGSKGNSSKPRR